MQARDREVLGRIWSGVASRLVPTPKLYVCVSGIWPTLANKCNPLASSFAKLSRSLFSHVGQLGVSTWIPTFEKPSCIWAFIWVLSKVTS